MPGWAWLIVGVALALLVVAVALVVTRRRRTERLRDRFGPEYDRTLQRRGDERRAEEDLVERERRHDALDIRPLGEGDRHRYAAEWQRVQAHFVDEPSAAVTRADTLIGEVMQARGYPMGRFEERSADVSVEHPEVVEHYRVAHRISQANADGSASTEDLRQAMVHYRALFEDLLETRETTGRETR